MKSIAVEMTLLILVIFGGIASNVGPQREHVKNNSSAPAGYPSPDPYPTPDPTAYPSPYPYPFVVSSRLEEPLPYPAPGGGSIMRFKVTFSEAVRGVDITDFSLTVTGLRGSTILSVSGSRSMYTVTVNSGGGTGTIRLDVVDDDSIENGAADLLGGVGEGNGNFTGGEVYDVNVPWIVPSVGTYDGWILESSETSSVGGTLNKNATLLRVGDDAANKQYRTLLSFDTSTLPEGAEIISVTLKFKHAGVSGTNPFNTHGNLLVDICEGAFKNDSALQLGDFSARCPAGLYKVKALIYTHASKVGDWYTQTLLPDDFQFINRVDVTQFRLRFTRDDNNDFGADFLRLLSGNAAEADRPQLVIEYYIP